jgi:molybdate transport system ATP-binding protein
MSADRIRIDLRLQRGSFRLEAAFRSQSGRLALLGPSGAGKSTLLACVAGLLQPDEGRIEVDGRVLLDTRRGIRLRPRQRRIGLVTQQGALFPHLTLEENVVFALRCMPRPERPVRAAAHVQAQEALGRLGLGSLCGRLPGQVSGGEARRAELARALVARPGVVLLDEPFSALDPATKSEVTEAFRSTLASSAAPWILVTHDREEALGLAQEVGILMDGQVRQVGGAHDVFFRPADAQVAEFLGGELAWEGEVLDRNGDLARVQLGPVELWAAASGSVAPGAAVMATLRPEDVTLWRGPVPPGGSSRNALTGTVVAVEPRGLHLLVRLDAGIPMAALLTRGAAAELEPAAGVQLGISFKAVRLHLILRSQPTERRRPSER